jgi:hypothetical protein
MEWERILFNIPIPTLLLPNAGGENCTTASNCASEMFGLYRTSLPSSTPYNRD